MQKESRLGFVLLVDNLATSRTVVYRSLVGPRSSNQGIRQAEDLEPPSVANSTDALAAPITSSHKSHSSITCTVNGIRIDDVLVDTGSTVGSLNFRSLTPLMLSAVTPTVTAIRYVTSSPLDVLGSLSCVVDINGSTFPDHQVIVARDLCSTAILGLDFLSKNSAIIDFSSPTPLSFRPLPPVGAARVTVREQMTIPVCHAVFIPVDCSNTFPAGNCLVSELSAFAQKHPELDVSTG